MGNELLLRLSFCYSETFTDTSDGVFSITEGGIYRCRGFTKRNILTPESEEVIIYEIVSSRVSVTLEPKWSQIYRGEKVTLRCEIRREETQWTYEWRPNRNSATSSEYKINSATESDSGEYRCRAKSGYKLTDWSDAFRLSVLSVRKPRATVRAERTIIPAGGSVTLSCSVDDSADWRIYWFRQDSDQPIGNNKPYEDFMVSDGGLYSCRGGRGDPVFYTETSTKVTIQKTVSIKSTVILQPNWPQIYIGEKVTLKCEIQDGRFRYGTKQWRKNNLNKPGWSQEYMITTATEFDSGDYSCRAGDRFFLSVWSDVFTLVVSVRKPRATVRAERAIIPAGGSVTLSCSVDGSADWRIYWFRQDSSGASTNINNEPGGVLSVSDGGLYSCRGGRGDPAFYTETSTKVTIQKTVSIKPTVILQPNWPQIYIGEKVTFKCEIHNGRFGYGTKQWRKNNLDKPGRSQEHMITTATESDSGDYSCRAEGDRFFLSVWSDVFTLVVLPKPRATMRADRTIIPAGGSVTLSCSVDNSAVWRIYWFKRDFESSRATDIKNNEPDGTIIISDGGIYSCRGGRGDPVFYTETSREVTIQKTDKVSVSPSWLNPGASVTLSCEGLEHQSAGWRFFWYKAVPDPSKLYQTPYYTYELLPGSTNGTEQNSFIVQGQNHTAGYVCRAGRGEPEFYTYYSEPKFIWSADSAAAFLTVSPKRVQHFRSESVTLTCKGNFTDWRVKRFTETGRLSDFTCSNWGRMTGSTCTINRYWSDSGVYWCESGSGEFSNAVNITVQNNNYDGIILLSPVHPVTEGDPVTLSCRDKENLLSNVFFYHNDKLIHNDSREELKISAVSKSDEGFYKCQHSGKDSPRSWMSVRAAVSSPVSSSSSVMLIAGPVVGVVLFILIILLISLWCCRRSKDSRSISSSRSESSNQSSNRNHVINQTGSHGYNTLLLGDVGLYESVKSHGAAGDGDVHVYESVKCPETAGEEESGDAAYSLIEVMNVGRERRPHERTPYSVLRTEDSGAWSPAATDEAVYSEIAMETAS
ncbi:obscurin-like [Poecilia reticulata]|uniref:obscurin-like n=1 Tax=Poecilia reticulata TaxID=8081 RepID=UPI0007EBB30F|nr:PREDICTED: obscurin-like [Poecilia reticulata]